MEQLSQNVTAC